MKKLSLLLATGFGLGLSPVASGTAGTLLGILLVLPMRGLALPWQLVFAGLCILLAVPVCEVAERHFGTKDDGRIVADEFLTFPLVVLAIPWWEAPGFLVIAFLAHRVFDIVKPPPARGLQAVRGGVGIVIDDVIASLYALILNHIIWRVLFA